MPFDMLRAPSPLLVAGASQSSRRQAQDSWWPTTEPTGLRVASRDRADKNSGSIELIRAVTPADAEPPVIRGRRILMPSKTRASVSVR